MSEAATSPLVDAIKRNNIPNKDETRVRDAKEEVKNLRFALKTQEESGEGRKRKFNELFSCSRLELVVFLYK